MDKVETIELEVTRKTKIKKVFNVDRSLQVYNENIETANDEIDRLRKGKASNYEDGKIKRLNKVKKLHLNKLRENT